MANAAVDSSELRAKILRWGSAVFERSTELLVADLQEAAPLGQTGETRRGIQMVTQGDPMRPAGIVRSIGKGGSFVEEGTRPHVIVAHGKALRFLAGGGRISQPGPSQRIATSGGGVVFATSVNHPGSPARPWFAPTVERWAQTHLTQAAESVAFA